MKFLISLAAIVCVVSLAGTIVALKKDPDPDYSMNKSFGNLTFIYLIIIPIILIVFGLIWFMM